MFQTTEADAFPLGNEFNQRTEYTIEQMQKRLSQERLYATSVFQTVLDAASSEQGMDFQILNNSGQLLLRRYSPVPSAFNACSCSVSESCPDSLWSAGHILCKNGNNCTKGDIVWSVPGLTKSCTVVKTLYLSDFRCFFNQTCIDILLSMFNVDMPNRLPLPRATRTFVAINSSESFSFLPNEKLDKLAEKLFVDKWKIQPDFVGYYRICAPNSCAYTIKRKLDIVYVVTTVIGLLGGLTVIMRLLVPVSVRFIHSIFTRCKRSSSNVDDQMPENDAGKNERGFFH
jgi:hypothetical protein